MAVRDKDYDITNKIYDHTAHGSCLNGRDNNFSDEVFHTRFIESENRSLKGSFVWTNKTVYSGYLVCQDHERFW